MKTKRFLIAAFAAAIFITASFSVVASGYKYDKSFKYKDIPAFKTGEDSTDDDIKIPPIGN
jgi:hypothetical protein